MLKLLRQDHPPIVFECAIIVTSVVRSAHALILASKHKTENFVSCFQLNDLFMAQFQDAKADVSAFADRLTARLDDIGDKCRSIIVAGSECACSFSKVLCLYEKTASLFIRFFCMFALKHGSYIMYFLSVLRHCMSKMPQHKLKALAIKARPSISSSPIRFPCHEMR